MIFQLSAIFCLLIVSMQGQLLTKAEARELFLLSLAFTVARGCWDLTMQLLRRRCRLRQECSPIEQDSLDVAIRAVGQQLDVGRIVGVTYDLPEGGPRGTYHLHVSLCLIPVDD